MRRATNELPKDVQDPPVGKWLKADYDRIVKAAGLDQEEFKLFGVVNFHQAKKEEFALYDSLREEFSASYEAEWQRIHTIIQ